MSSSLNILRCYLFKRLEWKLTFSSPVAAAEFSKFAGILNAASSFRIWNSSFGILSPPLVLFMVMSPKVHLTSHSRRSGFRWISTTLQLSKSLKPFFCTVFLCISSHLFLNSSASVRFLPFQSSIVPIFSWNVPLKRSLVFPTVLFFSVSLHFYLRRLSSLSLLFSGTLHSVGYIFYFLLCFHFSFFLSYL